MATTALPTTPAESIHLICISGGMGWSNIIALQFALTTKLPHGGSRSKPLTSTPVSF